MSAQNPFAKATPAAAPTFGEGSVPQATPGAALPGASPTQAAPSGAPKGLGKGIMIPVPVGLADVESSSAIPEGTYPAYLDDVQEGVSQSGNPKLVLVYRIATEGMTTRKVQAHLALTESALWKLKQHYEALNIDMTQQQVSLEEIRGTLVWLDIRNREFKDDTTGNVSIFNDIAQISAWTEPGAKYSA